MDKRTWTALKAFTITVRFASQIRQKKKTIEEYARNTAFSKNICFTTDLMR